MIKRLAFICMIILSSVTASAQQTSKDDGKGKAKTEKKADDKKADDKKAVDPKKAAKEAKAKADKEIASAKESIKKGQNLENVEKSMRKLLTDSLNCNYDKVWLTLFESVKKQYEQVNEKLYLKQQSDTAKFFNCTIHMFDVLEGLDSLDKGSYRKKHASYLARYRDNLYNGGVYFIQKQKWSDAYRFFDSYLDCAKQPLFTGYSYESEDKRMAEAAYWAVYCGYKIPDADKALKYGDLAKNDKDHYLYLIQYLTECYQVKGDGDNYQVMLEEGFSMYPTSPFFFPRLVQVYNVQQRHSKVDEICDRVLSLQPTNTVALIAKSSSMLSQNRYDECVSITDKIIDIDERIPQAYLNAGMAYYNQSLDLDKRANAKPEVKAKLEQLYRRALPYLEQYRKLAPDDSQHWGMPMYNIYYHLNMGAEFEEIENILEE